jgi:hypothetical protein
MSKILERLAKNYKGRKIKKISIIKINKEIIVTVEL